MKNDPKSFIEALVVDDNIVNTMMLAKMLQLFNIHADQAFRGEKAKAMSKKKSYDIIFIDHFMPNLNGLQTMELIRKEETLSKNAVIIILTAEISNCIVDIYKAAGANEILEKPLDLVQLRALLNKWCTNPCQEISPNSNKPTYYYNVLEASIKDIDVCINIITSGYENHSIEYIRLGVHKLKGILSSLEVAGMQDIVKKINFQVLEDNVEAKFNQFIYSLNLFRDKIQNSLVETFDGEVIEAKNKHQMTSEEYEHCLQSAIYYIKRYEYDYILKEIEHLVYMGPPKLKSRFEEAMKGINEYRYEKVLKDLIQLKKEIGDLPIPE